MHHGFPRVFERAESALGQTWPSHPCNSAISGARFERAREAVMASYVKRTIRLNPAQARILSGVAERRGLSEYSMLLKVIDAGFLSLLHGTDKETDLAEIANEIGSISERLAEAERVRSQYSRMRRW